METAEIFEAITPLFRDVLDIDDLELTPELTAEDVDEWDSLSHIRLIVAVEQELGIKFTTAEIETLANVGEFVQLIGTKL